MSSSPPSAAPADDAGWHPNAIAIRDAARRSGLEIELARFPEGTRTAQDAADAIGCEVAQIVKSLVFLVDGVATLALVSGANQLDERKLAAAAGGKKTKRADADQVRAATGYAIGGVPPLGLATEVPVFIDVDLTRYDVLWAAAGTPYDVFRITPQELLSATGGALHELRKA